MRSRLAVSTHLDDVVLSCFGVLGAWTTVVTVLAGVPPEGVLGDWDEETGAASSRERALERRREDAEALRVAGCACVQLDFPDSQYWGLAGLVEPGQAELAAAFRPLLAGADEVFLPSGIKNTDHQLVRDAALAVRPDATLYADLPYALRYGYTAAREGRKRRDVQLDKPSLEAKIAACRCYATQLDRLFEDYGRFLDGNELALEVFWNL